MSGSANGSLQEDFPFLFSQFAIETGQWIFQWNVVIFPSSVSLHGENIDEHRMLPYFIHFGPFSPNSNHEPWKPDLASSGSRRTEQRPKTPCDSSCVPSGVIKHGNGKWTIYRIYRWFSYEHLHLERIFQLAMFDETGGFSEQTGFGSRSYPHSWMVAKIQFN